MTEFCVVIKFDLEKNAKEIGHFESFREAEAKIIEEKLKILAARKKRKETNKLTDENGHDEWDKMMLSGIISKQEWFDGAFEEVDSFSIYYVGIDP